MPQSDYISRPIILLAIEHVGNMECQHRQKHEPLVFEYSNPYNDITRLSLEISWILLIVNVLNINVLRLL